MNWSKVTVFVLIGVSSLLLCGCVGYLEKIGCDALPGNNDKDHCYQDAAVRMGDPSVCEKIVGYDWIGQEQNPPKDKCYMRVADVKNDPSICGFVKGGWNSYYPADCYMDVAVNNKNTAACDLIGDTVLSRNFGLEVTSKFTCYAKAGSQFAYCPNTKGEEQVKCMAKEAAKANAPLLCEQVKATPNGAHECLLYAFSGMQDKAISGGPKFDYTKCAYFVDSSLKYTCSLLDAFIFDDAKACNNILETNYKGVCTNINAVTGENFNESMLATYVANCRAIDTPQLKAACLIGLGLHLDSEAGVSSEDEARNERLEIGAFTSLLEGCTTEGFEDPLGGKFCAGFLITREKPTYCEKMPTEDLQSQCFEIAAAETGDCTLVKAAKDKAECQAQVLPVYDAYFSTCSDPDVTKQDKCIEEGKTRFINAMLDPNLLPASLRQK